MARICEKPFAMSMEAVPLPQHLAARYLDEGLPLMMLRNPVCFNLSNLEHEDVQYPHSIQQRPRDTRAF